MGILASLSETFQVTELDVLIIGGIIFATLILYYYISLHRVFEAIFGAIIGLGIYVLLSVVLLGNPTLGTEGGLFPPGFAVFIVSLALYLVFVLAFLFPLHGGLVIQEPTQPTLYTLVYFFVTLYLLFALGAICIYMIEQSYVFRVGNIFTFFRETPFYEPLKASWYYAYVMSHQHIILPLGIVLMLYKLLLSNIINAALLSIWYNLANVGFYRSKSDSHYRVEFHEVGGGGGHGKGGDHGHDEHGHDDHHKSDNHGHH